MRRVAAPEGCFTQTNDILMLLESLHAQRAKSRDCRLVEHRKTFNTEIRSRFLTPSPPQSSLHKAAAEWIRLQRSHPRLRTSRGVVPLAGAMESRILVKFGKFISQDVQSARRER